MGQAKPKSADAMPSDQAVAKASIKLSFPMLLAVGLRSAAILGERVYRGKTTTRYSDLLLLAPAVENDLFRRAVLLARYHFPK